MTAVPVRNLAALALALTLIGCGDASSDRHAAADLDQAKAGGEAPGASAEARAYVAQFTKKDPEACFKKDVTLKQPALKGPAGQVTPRVPPTRVIVMIDGSGSMAGRMGGRTKLELAREAALGFVEGLPASVQTSLLVFGQQGNNSQAGKAKSCSAIDVLAPMSADRGPLRAALGQVRAVGWTPLAAGLDRAEALLAASTTPGEQIIYVVSDGEETCDGDPVAVARRINGGRTRAIVNVIGFNLPSGEAAKLTAVARAGGGGFVNLSNETELERYTAQVRESIRQTDNEVATSIATTDNNVATSIAITDADTCTTILATDEDTAMTIDLTDRETAGHPVPFKAEAKALLKARHDAMRARLEAYRTRLTKAEAGAKRSIDSAADAAR
ncbi:vWA domain-containing protein [Caulobacter sp. RL271]|jgi:Ca-activated chloride channel family protein|uniref:VWA domain-containing protein n=1 Tax=Caulobacter segnis TaxID=88688 RepID=A0ABY4ZV67_9CAUL|nr:VWA domain-containing protein [Caulobacter segnis]USQ96575.1 VWA domain-containing protein [Caulobacter segnis]